MRIGIVGAENSHTIHIARILNIDGAVPDCRVTHVWGETAEFAQKAAEEGEIPTVVGNPNEMIGHIDAVVVDHRDGKHHLPAARPFVEAGLPVFVDKPFCVDLSEGIEFTRFARARGVPIASFSTLPLERSVRDFARAIEEIGVLRALVTAGPLDLDSPYSGVFFYGIHQVELMLRLVEAAPLSVTAIRRGDDGAVVLTFEDGPVGVINALKEWWGGGGFHASAFGDEGVRHAALVSGQKPFLAGVRRFCEMFSTGVEPDPPSSYLTPVAVLDAMQRSFDTGAAVSVESVPEF